MCKVQLIYNRKTIEYNRYNVHAASCWVLGLEVSILPVLTPVSHVWVIGRCGDSGWWE